VSKEPGPVHALMLPRLPPARELIADRGYDSARFRAELAARGIAACIPSTRSRKQPIPHDPTLCRQRHRIEIAFGRIKDWRRIAMRYDRCAHTFLAAITLAATVTFWLNQCVLSLDPMATQAPHTGEQRKFAPLSRTLP
jgi:transposase